MSALRGWSESGDSSTVSTDRSWGGLYSTVLAGESVPMGVGFGGPAGTATSFTTTGALYQLRLSVWEIKRPSDPLHQSAIRWLALFIECWAQLAGPLHLS